MSVSTVEITHTRTEGEEESGATDGFAAWSPVVAVVEAVAGRQADRLHR